jgi:molybdopterin converting factor small subunit
MQIRVLYFGVLKDFFECGGKSIEMEEGASVADLLKVQRGSATGGGALWDSIAVAVNQEYARVTDVLQDGDEVALLPPVSGGAERRRTEIGRPEGRERYAG